MLGHIFGCGPTELTLRSAELVSHEQGRELDRLLARRLTGVPLAYVLGRAYFRGLELFCDERALIPRPETEDIVDVAIQCLGSRREAQQAQVVDMGTGSGNIGLALAHEHPELSVLGTDVDASALALADENRRHLGLTDRFRLVRGRTLSMFKSEPCIDVVATNPPYVAEDDPYVEQSVREFEPHQAVFAGTTGFEIITEMIDQAERCLKPGGWIVSEIGFTQAEQIRALFASRPMWHNLTLHRDLAGIERVLSVQKRP